MSVVHVGDTVGNTSSQRRARGTFAKWQQADGLWAAALELPPDPRTGARRRKVIRSKDERELDRKVDRLRLELRQHGDLPTASMTLTKWLDYWLASIDQSRPRTKEGYRSKIEQYIKPAIGRIKLDQLTPGDVRRLEQHVVKVKGLSSTSALQAYQILAKSLKDAEREGRVVRNVARLVNPPRRAVYRAEVLTTEQAVTVLRSVSEQRLRSRWATALLTGMRQGEVLGLEVERVGDTITLDWQLQRLRTEDDRPADASPDYEYRHLTGSYYLVRPKSRAGWRVLPLVEPLRSILQERIAEAATEPNPHGLLWTAEPKKSKGGHRELLGLDGAPIDPSRDNRAWHQVLAAAGVPDVRLHDARHSAVTLLYDLGAPEHLVQQIVGQSTVSVTRNYRHRSPQQLEAVMRALGERLTVS